MASTASEVELFLKKHFFFFLTDPQKNITSHRAVSLPQPSPWVPALQPAVGQEVAPSEQFAEKLLTTSGLLLPNHLLRPSLCRCEKEEEEEDPRAQPCGPQHLQDPCRSLVVPIPCPVSRWPPGTRSSPSLPPWSVLFFFFLPFTKICRCLASRVENKKKKSLLLMNKVVFFLPALTFPSRAGISPRGAVALLGVWDGSRGRPGTPELFHSERAGETLQSSMWLSLGRTNPPLDPPLGNTTHGPGHSSRDLWASAWRRPMGLGKKMGFTLVSQCWGLFLHLSEAEVAAVTPGLATGPPGTPPPREHPC